MTDEKTLPFAGTPEELEKYLLEFARFAGGIAGRHHGIWLVAGGALGSTNPNTVPWKIFIRRTPEGLTLTTAVRSLPWTRTKLARIAAFREGQLADYLTARVRGSAPEKFDLLRLREPFAPFGSGVAAVTASYSWTIVTGLAAFAGAAGAAVLASLPLMSASIRDVAAHAAALQQAGAIPLPSPAEAAATGAFGAAAIFAFPLAFFAALVHGAALTASDLGFRAARVPQASALFLAIFVGLAFFPFLSVLAVPLALLLPLAAHLAASLVWSRRRERVRDAPRPQKSVVLIGVLLAGSLAGVIVPPVSAWKENLPKIALFRDAWLLGNPLGKRIASAYYRYTLYSAEPIKELYAVDRARAARAQPIAGCADPSLTPRLRTLGFAVTSPDAPNDVVVGPGGVAPGKDLGELKLALDEHSRKTFRAGALRDLNSYAWSSLYYVGPLVVTLVAMGFLAPGVSFLFRKLPPKQAIFALSAISMIAILVLVLAVDQPPPVADPEVIADALSDARVARRHEAAFRASQLESTAPLAEPLLKACDDADLRVRLWAVAALGRSGDPRALPKLIERLDDPEIFVRYRAAEGLELLRDPKATSALEKVLRERSWYEGLYALAALRAVQPGKY
jgi:hypothetical protein